MNTVPISLYFSADYVEAREKFLKAAHVRDASIESFVLPGHRGARGETLAIDTAYLGPLGAARLLIVSSGTHGVEGFCGSGVQVAALHDDDLMARLHRLGIGLLMVHAINPYGFSHLQRTNQDNVDLNRHHIDFSLPLPANAGYLEVDPLALPETWPPTAQDQQALSDYIHSHGMPAYRKALGSGQYTTPNGMFFGGTKPTWNNLTVRAILKKYAADTPCLAWIDLHTGLGVRGHGEKLYAGTSRETDLARALAWWGADVMVPHAGESVSQLVSGPVMSVIEEECPQSISGLLALEFGTLPMEEMMYRLRASHWLIRHPEAPASQQNNIRQRLREAFYCDDDAWKGAVWGQARTAMLQALAGLHGHNGVAVKPQTLKASV